MVSLEQSIVAAGTSVGIFEIITAQIFGDVITPGFGGEIGFGDR